MSSRRKEVQGLLKQARDLVDQATQICEEDGLDGVSFMGQTFHTLRHQYGEERRLRFPGWYDNEYWQSSTADCELDTISWEEEEEEK